ncbi:hypothetical protein J2129_001716 [Methanofollis sp. W23]|nr:hypothetical protein [Methanofollis sp. W23]
MPSLGPGAAEYFKADPALVDASFVVRRARVAVLVRKEGA